MAVRLFKYFSSSVLHAVLPDMDGAVFKYSFPKDSNDPYELFLSINLDEGPELLAFYADVVGDIQQHPTTCFSRSPTVLPMWAHYAQSLEGFVLELDEAAIAAQYEEAAFGDVDYRDGPDPGLIPCSAMLT